MYLPVVRSRAVIGVQALPVTIETHLSNGLPRFSIVGLPEAAVKESKDRVRSAILTSGFDFPIRIITVNLAPADLPKEGGQYDLPIALSILAASHQIPQTHLLDYEWLGELSLSAELRAIKGCLPAAIQCATEKRKIFVPPLNVNEAVLVEGLEVFSATHLSEVVQHLKHPFLEAMPTTVLQETVGCYPDINEVKGQYHAKRALEIAAAGRHSLLMMGPPGTGKSMLASRLPGLLPPLSKADMLDVASVYSVARQNYTAAWYQNPQRPFRAPHHSASAAALVGGGQKPKPGEISLAHHGVLFLDELPEFGKSVLESLREPMESGKVTISRAQQQVTFPAQFQLIAAMNPCPCGYLTHPKKACRCSKAHIAHYQQKLSGPLLDRIDIQVEVPYLPPFELLHPRKPEESTVCIKKRVQEAQNRQHARQGCLNAGLTPELLREYGAPSTELQEMILHTIEQLNLSARAYHRILKVARTIADLEAEQKVTEHHLFEALSYRKLDACTL